MKSGKRFLIAILSGVFISLSLFYFMSQLISQTKKLSKSDDSENFIDFVRVKRISNTEVKKRELPKKPEVKENPTPKESFASNQDNKPNRPSEMKFDTPKLDIPLAAGAGGEGFQAGGGGMGGGGKNSEESPLVRMEPPTPPEAAIKGITGWCQLQFDVGPDGTVENPRVIATSHRGLYDQNSIKTILKWRYRPKMVEGKPVKRTGLKVRFDFGLE